MTSRTPTAPRDFGPSGKALWKAIQADYDLEVHELVLLKTACRMADRLEDLAAALVGTSLTTENSKGDMITHPLLVEQRMLGQALARQLASLRLPTGDTDAQPQRRGGARGAYGLQVAR